MVWGHDKSITELITVGSAANIFVTFGHVYMSHILTEMLRLTLCGTEIK